MSRSSPPIPSSHPSPVRRRSVLGALGGLMAAGLVPVGHPSWPLAFALTQARAEETGSTAPRILRSADTHEADYPTVKAVEYMSDLLNERSTGRFTIKVFHSRQLGEESDTIAMVQAGAIDMVRTSVAPFNALIPETRVLTLPFLFRDSNHFHAVLAGPIGTQILAAFEAQGLIGLAFYDAGARSFYTASRPITCLADMAGLRIRVQNSDVIVAMVEALGAKALKLPFGQVTTGLLTGLIDGAENNWPSYESTGHYEIAPHYSLSRHLMIPEVLVLSKTVWDSLTVADQALIRAAAAESVGVMRHLWEARSSQAEARVRAAGVQVHTPSDPKAFRAAVAPVYDRFVTDPIHQDLVRRIQASP